MVDLSGYEDCEIEEGEEVAMQRAVRLATSQARCTYLNTCGFRGRWRGQHYWRLPGLPHARIKAFMTLAGIDVAAFQPHILRSASMRAASFVQSGRS